MKLYQVNASRTGWDEYDAFVVWARDANEALLVAQAEAAKHYTYNFESGATVTEITQPETAEVVLGSFNAG